MALPPKPTVTTDSTAAVAAPVASTPAPVASTGEKKTFVLKKFGPARIGEGDAAVAAPTPTASGLDLVELSKAFYNTLTSFAQTKGVAIDAVVAFCADADKSQFPGHKDGRIAYATAGSVNSIANINGLLNKARGVGGGAALKRKIEEKDNKIAELQAKLAEIMAQLGNK